MTKLDTDAIRGCQEEIAGLGNVRRRRLSRTWNREVFVCERFCGRDPWSKETHVISNGKCGILRNRYAQPIQS